MTQDLPFQFFASLQESRRRSYNVPIHQLIFGVGAAISAYIPKPPLLYGHALGSFLLGLAYIATLVIVYVTTQNAGDYSALAIASFGIHLPAATALVRNLENDQPALVIFVSDVLGCRFWVVLLVILLGESCVRSISKSLRRRSFSTRPHLLETERRQLQCQCLICNMTLIFSLLPMPIKMQDRVNNQSPLPPALQAQRPTQTLSHLGPIIPKRAMINTLKFRRATPAPTAAFAWRIPRTLSCTSALLTFSYLQKQFLRENLT